MAASEQFFKTSGQTDPVWIHTEPYSQRPQFSELNQDIQTDVCVIGSGIVGIQTAYELVRQGKDVVMIEARDILSGETARTTGHLSSALDDGYTAIQSKHGKEKARLAAESHQWALEHVGEVAKQLNIECEYRLLPGYEISQYPKDDKRHDEEVADMKEEVRTTSELGLKSEFWDGYAIRGWDGKIDQRDVAVFHNQATFHPTRYLVGILKWLTEQPNFRCYTRTRMMSCEESGIEVLGMGSKEVHIKTMGGQTITCQDAVQATCIPLQKLSVVAQLEFHRTYAIAIRVPKDTIEDCVIYDQADPYKYVRFTACDSESDYAIVGGCDHKVGQEDAWEERYRELEQWVRERFTQAQQVDYKWSGQILEPVDLMAYIGLNQGDKHIYIATGDSGNGLTHGVIAGKLISDEIMGKQNEWASLYNPKRVATIVKSLPSLISHDVQINAQYKRFLESDIKDIEDLGMGKGGVLNPTASSPIAVYKDENGKVHKMSALCPHLKGVVCWNDSEKSWDCPIHGSRFSKDGLQLFGPAKGGLPPVE